MPRGLTTLLIAAALLAAPEMGLADNTPADAKLSAEVDRLLVMVAKAETSQAAAARLTELGPKAVPRLLVHLKATRRIRRVLAAACLQHCWSAEAVDPMIAVAGDPDKQISQIAMVVLRRHLDDAAFEDALAKIAAGKASGGQGVAEAALLESRPDVDKMLAMLQAPAKWPLAVQSLSRYYSRRLTPATRAMLESPDASIVRGAICGLIFQQDNAPATRRRMGKFVSDTRPVVREMGCEYLRIHGKAAGIPMLKAAAKDADIHVRAAAVAAIEAIRRRTTAPAVAAPRNTEPFEPYFLFNKPQDRDRLDTRVARARAAAGYPDAPVRPAATVPLAKAFVPPVRDYFDAERSSYGVATEFAGSACVHVGDDAAWRAEQGTVVAIAAGRVADVSIAAASWGSLVVIEHVDARGRKFCSLYAHLGPLVCVRKGQAVTAGQKIGAIGRSCTQENGGYVAHLHFGIHVGPAGGWVSGYIGPEAFKSGQHGWVDPQTFLRKRISAGR